jgi:long-subunit acyl-CoA synthetase (AMP-forming)
MFHRRGRAQAAGRAARKGRPAVVSTERMDHGARPDRDDDAATDVGGVVERLLRRNRSRGGMTALVGDARCAAPKTTFDELFRSVDDLAAGLIGLGVREGDRVGVASENFDRWIALDLAILSIGAVSVPRGADASTAEIAFCLGHAGCSVAFYETAELFERVRSEAPAVSATFVLRGAAPEGARTFEALLEDGRARNRVDGGAEVRVRGFFDGWA